MQHTSACDDCVVATLLGGFERRVRIHDEEVEALSHLADAGLVAPIRLVPRRYGPEEAAG